MHHQPQIVLNELIPRGFVARGAGQQTLMLLLGVERRREGACAAQVEREDENSRGEQFQQRLRQLYQPFQYGLIQVYAARVRGQSGCGGINIGPSHQPGVRNPLCGKAKKS